MITPAGGETSVACRPGASVSVVLQAHKPTRVLLQGQADYIFEQFILQLQGEECVRNLSDDRWGGVVSKPTEECDEVAFAQPERVTQISVRPAVSLRPSQYKASRSFGKLLADLRDIAASKSNSYEISTGSLPHMITVTEPVQSFNWGTIADVTADAPAFRISHNQAPTDPYDILVASPAITRAVAIGLGNDAPIQVLQPELTPGVQVESRDFLREIQQAWNMVGQQEASLDAPISVPLLILTAPRDGRVTVTLQGSWARQQQEDIPTRAWGAELPLAVTPPSLARIQGAETTCFLDAKLHNQRIAHSAQPSALSPVVAMQLDPGIEFAQEVRVVPDGAPLPVARKLLGVRIPLQAMPDAVVRGQIHGRVDGQPLVSEKFELPLDASVYTPITTGSENIYFTDITFAKPLELDAVTQKDKCSGP